MDNKFEEFELIINNMVKVYEHDTRPWLIGYSGGKDSTLLVKLVFETVMRIPEKNRNKLIYVVSSDTMVENPVVKNYMHNSSHKINEFSQRNNLNIHSRIIYPEISQSFWSLVIGLGYPTPEPPGFRWCTERLKIKPMNKFVNEVIDQNGEVIILLGVRKAESIMRMRNISSRQIEGKLLQPHEDIPNAYVFNPLTELPNNLVWEYLLKDDGNSPWGTNLKTLFNLYQGENLGEEQSVIGQIDKNKIPVTGNSRFGCWCCTIVKQDKSLQNFISKGSSELIPLRDFRNWLVSIRQNPEYRDTKRRNGTVYTKENGELGYGSFKLSARAEILEKLLKLQESSHMELITIDELKFIEQEWENDGDLSRRLLVDTYFKATGKKLPWDKYKTPLFDDKVISEIKRICDDNNLPYEAICKCLIAIDKNKHYSRGNKIEKEFSRLIYQNYIHDKKIKEETNNGN